MGTFAGVIPDVSGVPIREITPSTMMGVFLHEFGAPPGEPFVIAPGDNTVVPVGAYGAWPLWTRSVLSWQIYTNKDHGAALEIDIASLIIGAALTFQTWHVFGIKGSSTSRSDFASGIELPSGIFARFRLFPGTYTVSCQMHGSIAMRGV